MVWCICVPESVELLSQKVQELCRCGPQTWAEKFLKPIVSDAVGHRQSPIDIITSDAVSEPRLWRNPLKWNYPKRTTEVVNTGYCWKAHVNQGLGLLSGGPLSHQYELEQYHCHWGPSDSLGSEHLVDGQSYAAEIHYVHWNKRYHNFNEALKYGDGLAVLGVFLKVGKENPHLEKLIQLLNNIQYKDQATPFEKETLNPAALLPTRGAYYTYLGSLTTPPCNECVIWIVFKDPIEVSPRQLEAFRSMRSAANHAECCSLPNEAKIESNYRPPLPRGDRRVRLGFI